MMSVCLLIQLDSKEKNIHKEIVSMELVSLEKHISYLSTVVEYRSITNESCILAFCTVLRSKIKSSGPDLQIKKQQRFSEKVTS